MTHALCEHGRIMTFDHFVQSLVVDRMADDSQLPLDARLALLAVVTLGRVVLEHDRLKVAQQCAVLP